MSPRDTVTMLALRNRREQKGIANILTRSQCGQLIHTASLVLMNSKFSPPRLVPLMGKIRWMINFCVKQVIMDYMTESVGCPREGFS